MMKYLILSALLVGQSLSVPIVERDVYKYGSQGGGAPCSVNLKRMKATPTSGQANPTWQAWSSSSSSSPTAAAPSAVASGMIYDTTQRAKYLFPISVEGQDFNVELDTGSSDLWVIQTGFDCYQQHSEDGGFEFLQAESACNFGNTYSPGAGYSVIPDVHEQSCYGDGVRCVEGPLGYADVSFGGLTVNQIMGAPINSSYPARGHPLYADNQSGIMGLAYPALTSGFQGEGEGTKYPYNSIMYTIMNDPSIIPDASKQFFSLALSRDASMNGNGGIFTVGGLPDLTDAEVNVASPSDYSSAALVSNDFYSITIDNYILDSTAYDTGTTVIVDSGANVFYAPTATAELMNTYWSPAAVYSDGGYYVDCSATLTVPIGVTIGGKDFYITPSDLITLNDDGTCSSLIYATDGQPSLGDPLLKNTLAVFNWGANALSFYPRQNYAS